MQSLQQVDERYSETEGQFGESEAMWRWLVGVRREVGETPGAPVEWALSR